MSLTLPPFLMKRSKKELIQLGITAVLIIAFILLVIQGMTKQRARQLEQKANLAQVQNAPQEKGQQKKLLLKLSQEIKDLKLKRDPFNPPSRETAHDLFLNGIVWDKENPMAIINDTVVIIGSTIDGNTIMDITENSVLLKKDQDTFKLELKLYYSQ